MSTAVQIPLIQIREASPHTEFSRSQKGREMFAAMAAETQALLDRCNSLGGEQWTRLQAVPTGVLAHICELTLRGRYRPQRRSPSRAASANPQKKRRTHKKETLHRMRCSKLQKRANKHYSLLPELRCAFLQEAIDRNPSYYGLCQIVGDSCPVPDLGRIASKQRALAKEQALQEAERGGDHHG